MSAPKIVIVCNRFGHSVSATDAIDNAILCCSDTSQGAYEEMNPDCEVVAYPDELVSATQGVRLQWMYDHFGDMFLIPDSVVACIRMYELKGEDYLLTPRQAYQIVLNCYEMAQDAGAKLFGFNPQRDPRKYHGNQPFRLSGPCTLNGLGLIRDGSKLWFNPKIDLYPNVWISLLNAHHHRRAVYDDRFSFITQKMKDDGPSVEESKPEFLLLQKFFGKAVQARNVKPGPGKKNWNRWQPKARFPF